MFLFSYYRLLLPRLLPIHSYSQTTPLLKLIKTTPIYTTPTFIILTDLLAWWLLVPPCILAPVGAKILLLEPKYCVLLKDKGSCALNRRAGSGRWHTRWQVLKDRETTPILDFPQTIPIVWLLLLGHSRDNAGTYTLAQSKNCSLRWEWIRAKYWPCNM